jgi:hypothetical protein
LVPVEPGIRLVQVTLGEAPMLGGPDHLVSAFLNQQQFRSRNQVNGLQSALKQ